MNLINHDILTINNTTLDISLKYVSWQSRSLKTGRQLMGAQIVTKTFKDYDHYSNWEDDKIEQGYKITGIHKA